MFDGLKKYFFLAFLCIVAVSGTVLLLNYIINKPDVQVVEKEIIKYVTVEKVVIKYQQVKNANTETEVHKEKITETKPDGSQVITEREDSKTKTVENTQTNVDVNKDTTTNIEQKVVTKEIIKRNDWRLSAKMGLDLKGIKSLSLLTPIYGAELNRRIVGPFSVGVWGLSSGQAGVSISMEW